MFRPEVRLLELRSTYKWGGGPDKTILLSAQRHNPSRVKVVVAYIRNVHDYEFRMAQEAKVRGVTFYDIPENGKFDVRVMPAIRQIIRDHNINVIHSHDYKSDLFAYLVRCWLWRRRIALVSTAHAWVILGRRGDLYRRLDLSLMKRFDQLIAVSHSTKMEMIDAGVPPEMIEVIHNAIDTDAWALPQVRANRREILGLTTAFPVIGYVGRVMPEKDLVTWLRAAADLSRRHPGSRFVVVGDGRDNSTQQELETIARSLGIFDRVVFTGYQKDVMSVYPAFDIFLLTSRREGLPNCILEAMAMSIPVVTTDVAGAKELVIDGVTGFVLPQGDVTGIARALARLASDNRLRMKMGSAGRARVKSEFAFSKRMDRIEALYEKLIHDACGTSVRVRH